MDNTWLTAVVLLYFMLVLIYGARAPRILGFIVAFGVMEIGRAIAVIGKNIWLVGAWLAKFCGAGSHG